MTLFNGSFGLASLAMLQAADDGSFWMPSQSSTIAKGIDDTFYFIYWISVFFFVLIVGLMVLFIIKYRARDGQKRKKAPHHNIVLELVWTGIPLILVIAIFWATFKAYMGMATAPIDAYEITVTGQKWSWLFQYKTGRASDELVVPVDTPVKLNMRSEDVIHSFFIPAFRVKKDVVPGRYSTLWFEATEEGEYWALCAEYCGTSHSDMLAKVRVVNEDVFLDWVNAPEELGEMESPAAGGERMFQRYGCVQCHSLDGTAGTGPSLLDAYNTEHEMEDGTMVLVDDNYIRESILDPSAKVRAGYQAVMPTFSGKLKDNQIDWLIAYLKTCSVHAPVSEIDRATSVPVPDEGVAQDDTADSAAEAVDPGAGETEPMEGETESPAEGS